VGIYNKNRFLDMGGFDPLIKTKHWQCMDFGLRAWLWGERISSARHVRLSCAGNLPPEDATVDESYRRYFLKNLAPVERLDGIRLPAGRFLPFALNSRTGLGAAWHEWKEARTWLAKHSGRFRADARRLIEAWEAGVK
jgi:hypothetical protein